MLVFAHVSCNNPRCGAEYDHGCDREANGRYRAPYRCGPCGTTAITITTIYVEA